MDGKSKKTYDDSGNFLCVVESVALITICDSNKVIWGIMVMEFAWGKIWM